MGNWLSTIAGFAPELAKPCAARREVRGAVRDEIHKTVVTLNFALFALLVDQVAEDAVRRKYFGEPLALRGVEHYQVHQPEKFMRLPEWTSLASWNMRLQELSAAEAEWPLAFQIVSLLQQLAWAPMKYSASQDTRGFVGRILERPEVRDYERRFFAAVARAGAV